MTVIVQGVREEAFETSRSVFIELSTGNRFKLSDNNGSLRIEKIEGIMSIIPEELRRIEVE